MNDNQKNKSKGREYPLCFPDVDDRIPIIPYEEFRRIMLSRNIETNNPKRHNDIVHHFNPNSEHWLKTFMDLYLQEYERKRT